MKRTAMLVFLTAGGVTIENPNADAVPLPAAEYRDRTLSLGGG